MDAASPFDRPLFILSAPRSGSTLLFETLQQAPGLVTLGGESHRLIEGIPQLTPVTGMVESNRLGAEHAREKFIRRLHREFWRLLCDRDGMPARPNADGRLRFLEKTPKNALRVPFLDAVFPGAQFVWLYREPRGNLASMIEAWRSGRFVTYPTLRGWDGPPWSLLLPPGWRELNGQPLEAVCAAQWEAANRIALDDLEALGPGRWTAVDYDALVEGPEAVVDRLCAFAGIERDPRFDDLLRAGPGLSRSTLTAPDEEKWRRYEAEIEAVLPALDATRERAEAVLARASA